MAIVYRDGFFNSLLSDSCCAPIPARLTEQYAQCAEDVMVKSLLDAFSRSVPNVSPQNSIYLEIGANHPISGSNTYLLNRGGYNGILVEANPKLIPELQRLRPDDLIVNVAITPDEHSFVNLFVSNRHELSSLIKDFVVSWHGGRTGLAEEIKVPALRINDFLTKYVRDKAIAYLSIDIEGIDCAVLSDMDFSRWRPSLIQAEPSDQFNDRGSEKITELLAKENYILIAFTTVNLIFVVRVFMDIIKLDFQANEEPIGYLERQVQSYLLRLTDLETKLNKTHSGIADLKGRSVALRQENSIIARFLNRSLERLLGIRLVRVRTLDRLFSSEAVQQDD